MRNFIIELIDFTIKTLIKARYRLLKDYVDPAATDLLLRWKKAYPEKFGAIHTPIVSKEPLVEPVSDNIDDVVAEPHKPL